MREKMLAPDQEQTALPAMEGRPFPGRDQRGFALMISLLIIILISALLVGYVTTARLELMSSHSYAGGVEAALFAQMGSDTAIAKLKSATSPGKFWISKPGGLLLKPLNGDDATYVDLSSGRMAEVEENVSVNLNPAGLIESTGLIMADAGVAFPVQWKYVTKRGDILDTLPEYTEDNSVIGRYAFWVDDDGSRLNWNTAWTGLGPNTTPANHPSHLDLTAVPGLTGEMAAAIHQFRINDSLFNTPDSIREMGVPEISEIARLKKFAFTHFNHSPNRNIFGEPRIVLTTKASQAGTGVPYIEVLADESIDSGLVSNVDLTKLNIVFKSICQLLRRTDWPIGPGAGSFYQKYGEQRSVQTALNIIEYVRSVESGNEVVEPLQVTVTGTIQNGDIAISALSPSAAATWQYLGNTRGPRITEMGIHVPNAPTDGKYICSLLLEVFNPPGAGGNVDLSALKVFYSTRLIYPYGNASFASTSVFITTALIHNAGSFSNPLELEPGGVRVLRIVVPVEKDTENRTPPEKFFLKAGLFSANNKILDFVPYNYTPHYEYRAEPGIPEDAIETAAVLDPMVNRSVKNWLPKAPNTFGSIPIPNPDVSIAPQQDADASGAAIDPVSVWSSSGPKKGVVTSIAELGFIHTGIGDSVNAGVPFRTLRLQPRKTSDNTLPDWLLADCFSAPILTDTSREAAVVKPSPLSVGGRLNINGAMPPFDDEAPVTNRDFVRLAWLKGTPGLGEAEAISDSLSLQSVAEAGGNRGRVYGDSLFTDQKTYITPGAISEITGIADQGEASEANLRGMMDLIETRSNVFSIYAIGQSIQQTASKVVINGERRHKTTVERTDDGEIKVLLNKELGL